MLDHKFSLNEDIRFRVMRILERNPDTTQRELAHQLGVSLGAINFCLRALADKGLVKMANFAYSKNKFKYVYLLTPAGIAVKAELTSSFLKRKIQEYESLKAEIEALQSETTPLRNREQAASR